MQPSRSAVMGCAGALCLVLLSFAASSLAIAPGSKPDDQGKASPLLFPAALSLGTKAVGVLQERFSYLLNLHWSNAAPGQLLLGFWTITLLLLVVGHFYFTHHSQPSSKAGQFRSAYSLTHSPSFDASYDSTIKAGSQSLNVAALQHVRAHLATFATPQNGRSAYVVGATIALWLGMLMLGAWWFRRACLDTWWGVALTACWMFVRTGTFVRAFVLMHDASHGALFTKRWLNTWSGSITGLMVGMDFTDYQRTHGQHHALLGIEEEVERDPDLTVLFTTREWAAWPAGISKAAARVLCEPLFFFTVFAPVWIMAFNVAWPNRVTHQSRKMRALYILGKLAFLPCLYAAFFYTLGTTRTHLIAELIVQQCALSYAMFLYHIEHTFEGVYRVPKTEFNRTAAGLLGSSYLPMPWWWQWATVGVEYHHIHHANARVPCYRMQECEESAPPGLWEAAGVRKLTARDGFRALVLSLWDPDQRRYVPFPAWRHVDALLAPELYESTKSKLA